MNRPTANHSVDAGQIGCDPTAAGAAQAATSPAARRRPLRAPRGDREVFSDPPLAELGEHIQANRLDAAPLGYDCQGRSLARLRRETRRQAVQEARRYTSGWCNVGGEAAPDAPVIAAGHQPELVHPGVWVKHFVLSALAHKHDAVALQLVVDNDTIKSTSVRVPGGTLEHPETVAIPFDRWQSERPWEELAIGDRDLFATFGRRVQEAMADYPFEPLAGEFWPEVVRLASSTTRLGWCFTAARNLWERRWDAANLELPLSRLCQTEGFYWFASHLLARLPRFRRIHNEELAAYRMRNRIRSQNHPVAALGAEDEWLEAPFWVWRRTDTRRRQLFARQRGKELLLSDGSEQIATLPLHADADACCAVEVLSELHRRGIKLRTRALTTTLFSRLVLTDLFIHGIGGAKYDELADSLIERFFGFRPPGFLTLSATVLLPVEKFATVPEELHRLDHLLRDLVYNPDRHLPKEFPRDGQAGQLVARKREAVGRAPDDLIERRQRFLRIRELNRSLQPFVEQRKAALLSDRRRTLERLAANRVLTDREYPFCVYPAALLREFFDQTCGF